MAQANPDIAAKLTTPAATGAVPTSLAAATAMSAAELLALFTELDAPEPGELDGEYAGGLPADRDAGVRRWFKLTRRGAWLGKGYVPSIDDPSRGEGYNVWRKGSREVRSARFAWSIGDSPLDGRPSLIMRYAAFGNAGGVVEMIDEVRRIGDGLYLGTYTTSIVMPQFTRAMDGPSRTRREVFLLGGPPRECRGPDDPQLELRGGPPTVRASRALFSLAPARAAANVAARLYGRWV